MFLKAAKIGAGIALGFSFCVAPALAKDFHLLLLGGVQVKWGDTLYGTPATVRYAFARQSFDESGARNCSAMEAIDQLAERADVSNSLIEEEASAAFGEWSAVAGVRFEKVDNVKAADLVIGVQRFPRGYAYTNVRTKDVEPKVVVSENTQERGINLPQALPNDRKEAKRAPITPMAKALICFNPEREWKVGFGGNEKAYDIRYTLLHEIGHVLGLDHVVKRAAVMNFKYTEAFRTPQAGDIEGAQLLYGLPAKSTR